jgi:hypothetical protein
MFKKSILDNFYGCCSKDDFCNIRKELKKYGEEKLKGELEVKEDPFSDMVLGKSKEIYFDCGDFILTCDRYNSNHKLLIPKNLSYINVIFLKKEDIPVLEKMKETIKNNLRGENTLFFHCYPFNSIQTLHLHIINSDYYYPQQNDINIEDVISVLLEED